MQKEGDRSYLSTHERASENAEGGRQVILSVHEKASGNAEGGRQVIFKRARKGVWECRRRETGHT